MKFTFFLAFLFFWSFAEGQSSAIGLHIGNVPQCTQIAKNQNQENTITSNQCYSLGLSYHRSTKKQLFFALRLQYQNMVERVERNSELTFINFNGKFKFTNIDYRAQKEIIILPSVYWMTGEHQLKPIVGFGIPLSILGSSRQNISVTRENTFSEGNRDNINTFQSSNEIIQEGGLAIGLMAILGMNYQLNKSFQFRFNFTPTIYYKNLETEIENMFSSKNTEIIIFDGIPDPPKIEIFSKDQSSQETIKGVLFQEDVFLFSILFQF